MFCFDSFLNRVACVCSSGRRVSYGELADLSGRVAALTAPRRLAFCLCGNNVGSLVGYLAFLKGEVASLLLDANMAEVAFAELAALYRPSYVWAPEGTDAPGDFVRVLSLEGYSLWVSSLWAEPVAEELAVLLTTSGSTGSPKLVRLSKENLRSNAAAIVDFLHITCEERPVLSLPMFYAFGLSIVNSHLLAGATLLLPECSFVEERFFRFATEQGFTSFSGVPYSYETIERLQLWRREMPSLRTLTQSGGKLSEELVRFFAEKAARQGVRFFVMYGQTEGAARMSFLDPDCVLDRPGSIGKAIPGGRLSLIDEAGATIAEAGRVGELVYEGPNVGLGYAFGRADLLKGDENGGVVHTGDLAYRDEEGFYYIAGRKARSIKLFGLRISLDHIEQLLRPLLKECACVGGPSGVCVYTSDGDCDAERIVDFLAARTRIVRSAFVVRRLERIPRNEAGKVLYHNLNIR